MKVAVISDVHGNMAYLDKAKEVIDEEAIESVICCGDIQTDEVFRELDSWKNKVYLVLGNADKELSHKLEVGILYPENMEVFSDFGVINLAKKKIAFCHYDFLARKLAGEKKYDLIFYGHTHTPWEEQIGQTKMLNPGEIAAQFGKATFAVYDLAAMRARLVLLQ